MRCRCQRGLWAGNRSDAAYRLAVLPRWRRRPCRTARSHAEYSGPTAAISKLFDGKICIICDRENSDDDAVELVAGEVDRAELSGEALRVDGAADVVEHFQHPRLAFQIVMPR